MGNTGDGGTKTGNVVVDGGGGGGEVDEDVLEEGVVRGRPDAARALTTASQPVSSVLILAFNSSFSFSLALSLPLSSTRCSSEWRSWARLMPARSCLFSSSRSATRRSR